MLSDSGEGRILERRAESRSISLKTRLTEEDTVFVVSRTDRRGTSGFLDDTPSIFTRSRLLSGDGGGKALERAAQLAEKAVRENFDNENGGFFFSGRQNEKLIMNLKEDVRRSHPSGNSVMAFDLSVWRYSRNPRSFARFREAKPVHERQGCRESCGDAAFYLYSALPAKEVICVRERKRRPRF
jgi:uncharacterized protein YyaL (SSP411 family)